MAAMQPHEIAVITLTTIALVWAFIQFFIFHQKLNKIGHEIHVVSSKVEEG